MGKYISIMFINKHCTFDFIISITFHRIKNSKSKIKRKVLKSSISVVPLIGQIQLYFKKYVEKYGLFVRTIKEIKKNAKSNKIYRIYYSDEDEEGIILNFLENLVASPHNC